MFLAIDVLCSANDIYVLCLASNITRRDPYFEIYLHCDLPSIVHVVIYLFILSQEILFSFTNVLCVQIQWEHIHIQTHTHSDYN